MGVVYRAYDTKLNVALKSYLAAVDLASAALLTWPFRVPSHQ